MLVNSVNGRAFESYAFINSRIRYCSMLGTNGTTLDSSSYVHTDAFLSCEQVTILLVTGDQSIPEMKGTREPERSTGTT